MHQANDSGELLQLARNPWRRARWRFVERLSTDPLAVSLVAAEMRRTVVVTCHSQLFLAAAGAICGVRCTAFFGMRLFVELAGGRWVEPDPFSLFVADGHVLSAIGWPAHGEIISGLLRAMGTRVGGGRDNAVLFLCADYVADYEADVPFRALAGVGWRVEAACPTKRKCEACVTAIYDAAPRRRRRAADRGGDVDVDQFDCVVVPGGRAPELLVTHDKAVALVNEFAANAKGKVVASIDQGHLLVAAAGLLEGKNCASGVPTRVIADLAGAVSVEHEGAVIDGKLVTAASWPDLPKFIAHIINLLGITVSF